jgi:hypothetical protein
VLFYSCQDHEGVSRGEFRCRKHRYRMCKQHCKTRKRPFQFPSVRECAHESPLSALFPVNVAITCAHSEHDERQHRVQNSLKNHHHSHTRRGVSPSGGCSPEAFLSPLTVERSEHTAHPAQRRGGETTAAECPPYSHQQASVVGNHVALIPPPLLRSHRSLDASELETELGAGPSLQCRASGGAPAAGRPAM